MPAKFNEAFYVASLNLAGISAGKKKNDREQVN